MKGLKNFYVKVIEWKSWACMMFTATVIIYSVISVIFGEWNLSIFTLFGLLVVSAACSFIQFLCFTDNIIKKMKYSLRSLLFVVLYFPVLAGCGYAFKWFPTNSFSGWAIFVVIFIVFFAIFTVCFEIYFKLAGRKYDGILGQYKKQQEEKNNR